MGQISKEKLAYTIDGACDAISVGRTGLYAAIKRGEIEKFTACGRTLIPYESLKAYIDRAREASSSAASANSQIHGEAR